MVHGQGAVLVGSDSDAVRFPLVVAVGAAARYDVSGGARVCTLRFCEIDKWAMSCPAVAGLYYAA